MKTVNEITFEDFQVVIELLRGGVIATNYELDEYSILGNKNWLNIFNETNNSLVNIAKLNRENEVFNNIIRNKIVASIIDLVRSNRDYKSVMYALEINNYGQALDNVLFGMEDKHKSNFVKNGLYNRDLLVEVLENQKKGKVGEVVTFGCLEAFDYTYNRLAGKTVANTTKGKTGSVARKVIENKRETPDMAPIVSAEIGAEYTVVEENKGVKEISEPEGK